MNTGSEVNVRTVTVNDVAGGPLNVALVVLPNGHTYVETALIQRRTSTLTTR